MTRTSLHKTTALVLALLLHACSDPGSSSPGQIVTTSDADVDGRTVRFATGGAEGPTVVFEAGLGSGMEAWDPVLADTAALTTVFAYDRPGYGGSDATSSSRSVAQVVAELRALLEQRDLHPPFILVGHSLGWQFCEYFARTYPSEVLGVVAVDGRAVDLEERCLAAGLHERDCSISEPDAQSLPEPVRSEVLASDETLEQMRTAESFPPVPLVVLARGMPDPPDAPAEWETVWRQAQHDLAMLSEAGRLVIAERSGHILQASEPELIVQAIVDILDSDAPL